MKEFIIPHLRHQEKVNAYFQSRSSYWKDIYASGGAQGEVYRQRQVAALAWIEELALAPGSRVLEIGCGAGFLAVSLAERGLRVNALDSAPAMVEVARQHAEESRSAQRLSVELGDMSMLAFEDASFDLVIAIGVIPWLERPELAIQEMARVTRPRGHVLLTADNRVGLTNLLDPWYNPALRSLRRLVKDILERLGLRPRSLDAPGTTFHSPRFIDAALADAQLIKTRSKTLGFGPFSFLDRTVLPEPLGTALHHRLQCLADRGLPGCSSMGAHYLVLVKKLESPPLVQSTRATGESVSVSHGQYHLFRGTSSETMQDERHVQSAAAYRLEQEKVNAYFQSQSSYWKDIYASGGVQGEVFRQRRAAALAWIEELALAPGSRVLEIGCGAGFLAVSLAERGLRVNAIDATQTMVEVARRQAEVSTAAQRLSVELGDVSRLAFEDASFDLVIAIGVIAYLWRPEMAIQEMARVTRPGGHVLLTAANWAGLNNFIDPWYNPALRPLKRLVKDILEQFGLRPRSPNMTFHSPRFIDAALADAQLIKTRSKTLGFGPFSFLRRSVLPEVPGLALHRRLQHLADRGVPGFRATGMSYLALARKPTCKSAI